MAKIKGKLVEKVTEKEEFVEKIVEASTMTKGELLDYHLSRIEGNFLSKSEAKAIFQSLFRD